jgi:hypothetical protein
MARAITSLAFGQRGEIVHAEFAEVICGDVGDDGHAGALDRKASPEHSRAVSSTAVSTRLSRTT